MARRNPPDELALDLPASEPPGSSAQRPLSVGDLTRAIGDLLENRFPEIWVSGEISNFRAPGSGHLYFTLKDENTTLQAVMFRNDANRIGFALQDGQSVVARGRITVYEVRGQYQLQVAEISGQGQGLLQQRFEQLKAKLQAEGLFALERKRPLPVFPEKIGIVTSLQGAVLQDMLRILQRRAPGIHILVRGVLVQGPGAEREITEAIHSFSTEGQVDLLVIARGGGSLEDLWAFNEESVARALAACSMPTISAVGHETDFSIADFVADLRAPTPSAAAELLTRDWAEWRGALHQLGSRLHREVRQELQRQRREWHRLATSYALREPKRALQQWAQRVDDLAENLLNSTRQQLRHQRQRWQLLHTRLSAHPPARELIRHRQHLHHLAARLRMLGPQGTLDRGYALLVDEQGHPIRRVEKKQEGKNAQVILSQGLYEIKLLTAQPEGTLPSSPSEVSPKKSSRNKRSK